jgi:hypothetical protein
MYRHPPHQKSSLISGGTNIQMNEIYSFDVLIESIYCESLCAAIHQLLHHYACMSHWMRNNSTLQLRVDLFIELLQYSGIVYLCTSFPSHACCCYDGMVCCCFHCYDMLVVVVKPFPIPWTLHHCRKSVSSYWGRHLQMMMICFLHCVVVLWWYAAVNISNCHACCNLYLFLVYLFKDWLCRHFVQCGNFRYSCVCAKARSYFAVVSIIRRNDFGLISSINHEYFFCALYHTATMFIQLLMSCISCS